jgi:hypothetical protein
VTSRRARRIRQLAADLRPDELDAASSTTGSRRSFSMTCSEVALDWPAWREADSTSREVPKFCTCGSAKPAFSSVARMRSTSAALS